MDEGSQGADVRPGESVNRSGADVERDGAEHDVDGIEHDVESYLRETPEFFVRHRDLVAGLEIPHDPGGTVSLVEYQVKVLRRESAKLRARVAALIENARRNEDQWRRMHRLALRLLEARELGDLFAGFYASMDEEFGVDRTVVKLIRSPASPEHVGFGEFVSGDETLDVIARSHDPVCGGLDEVRLRALFGESAAEVASAATVGLEGSIGVLALGSRDPDRFGARMGTLFLHQLAALLSHALRRHVVR